MKKSEILRELPNVTKGHKVGKHFGKIVLIYRLVQGRVDTNLQFVKNAISAKVNKAKGNKTRCLYILLIH